MIALLTNGSASGSNNIIIGHYKTIKGAVKAAERINKLRFSRTESKLPYLEFYSEDCGGFYRSPVKTINIGEIK